jgi:hypothetical protein
VTPNTDCEHARMTLMASLDGENGPESAADRQHVLTCAPCRRWLEDLQSVSRQLDGLPYQSAQIDLWSSVEGRIRESGQMPALSRRLWLLGATVLVWRAVQLFIDLPLPILHPLVPLAAAVVAVWLIAGDPLAIETSAPELQKRGI